MQSENIFTQTPFTDWEKKCSLFLSKGALAFAKKYPSSLSYLIQGLNIEFNGLTDNKVSDPTEEALEKYEKGAELGDPLCCLRLYEAYSSKNNFFEVPADKEKALLYIILGQLFAMCSPFGLEEEINLISQDFVYKVGDDPTMKKSLKLLENSSEPIAKKYKQIVSKVFSFYYDQTIPIEEVQKKFKNIFENQPDLISDSLLGIFILNMFTGDYDTDAKMIENEKVYTYFNNHIIDLFRLFNTTFQVQGEIHAASLVGLSINVYHFLLWKGKSYKGEIDACLHELIRMCNIIINNNDRLGISPDAIQLFVSIIAGCYAKGFFVKRNRKRAFEYYTRLDEKTILHANPNLAFAKAKLQDKLGLKKDAEALYNKVYTRYLEIEIQVKHAGESLLPSECYILAVLEEKLLVNEEKAKEYYHKALQPLKGDNFKPFETLAYQRKCLRNLEKFQREN